MTKRQLQQVIGQLPEEEHFDRAYIATEEDHFDRSYPAFEGGIRVISKDERGCEYRYNVSIDAEGNASIKPHKRPKKPTGARMNTKWRYRPGYRRVPLLGPTKPTQAR